MADPVLVPAQPAAPPATVDPHPLVPVIKDAIDDLAKSPPGPVADAKAANLTALIGVLGDVLANPAVGAAASSIFAALPVGVRAWVLIAAAGLALAGGGFSLGRYTAPGQLQAPAAASPIVAPAVSPSLKLYLIPGLDAKALASDPALAGFKVSVDPTTYAPGSKYPWAGQQVQLPAVAIIDGSGKVLDVRGPFSNAAELAALAKK